MKSIFIYLLLIFLIGNPFFNYAQEYDFSWSHPSPQGNAIWSIAFADETTGYAVGGNGIILKTTDVGDTWNIIRNSIATFDELDLYDVVVSPTGNIFAAGANGKILKSDNEGLSWYELSHATIDIIYDLCINPNGNISCCGTNGTVLMSEDNGNTWTEIGIQSENTIGKMYWKSENECYLVVLNEGFYRSTDMGQNWSLAIDSPFEENNDIFFVNENRGLALRDYAVFTTDDGGETWENSTSQMNIADELYATVVLTEDNFISTSIGEGGEIQETVDGGYNWEMQFEHEQVLGFTNIIMGPMGRIFFGSTGSGIFYRNQNMDIVNCTLNLSDEQGDEVNLFKGPDNILFAYLEPYPTNAASFHMLIKSDDLGENWYLSANPPFDIIYNLSFDNQIGIAIGLGGVRISNDAGNSWQETDLPVNTSPLKSSMPSSEKYFVICSGFSNDNELVLSSTDGGNTWTESGAGLPGPGFVGIDIVFPTLQTGFALGHNGDNIELFKTNNSAEEWEQVSTPAIINASSMAWLNVETGFICSSYYYAPGLFKTNDGGQTWTMISDERFSKVVVKDDNTVIAFNRYGSSTAFFESTDSGETFDWVATPFDDGDYSQYPNNNNGICSVVPTEDGWFFGGYGSKIIKATATITGFSYENKIHKSNKIEIISINPNPTTAKSIIELKMEEDSKVKIITYNTLGIVVHKSKIISLTKGKHKLTWDGNKLPKGNYLIKTQSNSASSTTKIIKQ